MGSLARCLRGSRGAVLASSARPLNDEKGYLASLNAVARTVTMYQQFFSRPLSRVC